MEKTMRKILSILMVITLAFALFAGCTSDPKTTATPTNTTSPTATPGDITPTPTPEIKVAEKFIPNFEDVIAFNVFNTSDYQARWDDYALEYLLENYNLEIKNNIPGCTGFESTAVVLGGNYMGSESKRLEYNTLLGRLYQTEVTIPDFYPSLYASSIGLDAPWKLYSNYFVDLNEYLAEDGPLYQGYINWVWKGNADYFNQFKAYLENDDGELFVLPRREKMPVRMYIGWNKDALKQINVEWDDKAQDWTTLVEQLSAYYAKSKSIALQSYCGNISDYIKFVAATYGLDFNDDFSWTTKNGEPLWTYCWNEYLNILTDIKDLAEKHLVYNDNKDSSLILGYDLDPNNKTIQKVAGTETKWQKNAGSAGLVVFALDTRIAVLQNQGASWSGLDTWYMSDTVITHDGYQYALSGSSEFDIDYIAIGNSIDKQRGDHEFTNRICQYLAEYMNDDGFNRYFFGEEGLPFAETFADSGSWEWIDFEGEKKVIYTNHENRVSWTRDTASPDRDAYFWEGRSDNWYVENLDPHYEQYINYIVNNKDAKKTLSNAEYGASVADEVGFTDGIGCYESNKRSGIYFFADITAFPMEKTIYWPMESESRTKPFAESLYAQGLADNTIVFKGFFKSVDEVFHGNGAEITEKISSLKTIAKNFTTEYLANKRAASTWNSYIKNLKDAGYEDVFNYYSAALEICQTEHIDSIKSQSDVNKEVFNIID